MFTIIASALGVLITIIIVLKVYRTRQQYKAASNLVFAKYTHQKLNGKQQKAVHEKAKQMVLDSNSKLTGFANEVERFGWYALAMNELNIDSMIPENPHWQKVKNPYLAIFPGNYLIRAVCLSLKNNYGIDIDVSEKKNYKKSP